MDELNPLEEIRNWQHPPWYGIDQFEEKVTLIFLAEGSLPPLPGCQWSDKWFLVHVRKLHKPPSRWTQSQTLLAERRIISPFHWSTLTSPELLIRTWMLCKKAASMTIGISMGQEICLIVGQVYTQFTLLDEKLPDGKTGPGGDWHNGKATSRPDHVWPELWKGMSKRR